MPMLMRYTRPRRLSARNACVRVHSSYSRHPRLCGSASGVGRWALMQKRNSRAGWDDGLVSSVALFWPLLIPREVVVERVVLHHVWGGSGVGEGLRERGLGNG